MCTAAFTRLMSTFVSLPHVAVARFGRQDLDETPTLLSFDGARVDSKPFAGATRLWLSAYGGVPVHHFEASSSGDLVVGAAAGLRPWRHARLRVDYLHLRDEFLALDRRDDLLGVRWWQSFDSVRVNGLHTWRDSEPRDLVLRAVGAFEGVADVQLGYRELLSTQRQQVTELDPFWSIAFDYVPYRQVDATLTRDLGHGVVVGGGFDLRRLRDRSDEAAFNREFEHYYADLTWSDVVLPGLSLTAAGNLYESSGESFRAFTGEAIYRPDAELRVALGLGYDLFRFDALDRGERVHVRTYYLRGDYRLHRRLRVDGAYELQRDDVDEFHLFRVGLLWTF